MQNATVSCRLQHAVSTNPKAENLALAVIANEFLEPVRYIIVLLTTVPVARALGRAPKDIPDDAAQDKQKIKKP